MNTIVKNQRCQGLILLLLFWVNAAVLWAQETYSVNYKSQSMEQVVQDLRQKIKYDFVYQKQLTEGQPLVTVKLKNVSLQELLTTLFTDHFGLEYEVVNKSIVLRQSDPNKVYHLRGHVFDNEHQPLAGATVYIKDTHQGVVADAAGKFEIKIMKGQTLAFSYLGFETKEMRYNGFNNVNVILTYGESHRLDNVVVTGYQTISRERSAGSFATVKGNDLREQANIHGNLLRSLEGKTAGLSVSETADGVKYLVRGISSINAKTEPLFIVDGVAMTKTQMDKMVNPNDVESVNLLKDATAASIWGAQAANGVIVITTKSGKTGSQKLQVTYNGSFTFKGMPDWSYMDQMSSSEFIKAATEVFDPQTYKWSDAQNNTYGLSNDYRIIYPHEYPLYQYYNGQISLDERDAMLGKLSATNGRKEYEKYFMSNAMLTNHSVSLAGESDKSSYYASIEMQKEQGTERNTNDEYRLFLRDTFKPTKWLSLDLSLNAFYSQEKSYIASDRLSSLPYVSYYDADGSELSLTNLVMHDAYRQQVEQTSGIDLTYRPVSDFRSSTDKTKTQGIFANLGLNIDITKWLKFEGRYQYSRTNSTGERYLPSTTFAVREERAQGTDIEGVQYLPSSGGRFTSSNTSVTSYTLRNQLSVNKSIGDDSKHSIIGIAGFEVSGRTLGANATFMRGYDMQTMQHIMYNDYELNMTGVKNPALPAFAASSTNTFEPNQYEQSESEYRFVSMYANGAYTLLDKYSLNASVRVDQSNLFGSDPSVQFKPIWAVGGIWNLSKERFMSSTSSWLSRLNLRLSFGYAGNSPEPGKGGPYNILSSISNPDFSRFGLGYVVTTPANDKLAWEKTRTLNFGIDWAILGGRVSGEIDLYDKRTTNLLGNAPCDPTTGFSTVLSNIGTMINRGVEINVNSTNLTKGKFEWSTDFNFTYNYNKLVEMYVEPPSSPYRMVSYDYWEGRPYGTVFAYRWAGLSPDKGMPRVYDSQSNVVGSITDIDTEEAVKFAGTTVPPFFGSMGNTFRYGNFDLSILLIYNLGHVMRNDINRTYSYRLGGNLHKDFAKRWRQPGDEAHTDVPAYYSLKDTSINESDITMLYPYADVNVLSASYFKIREVSVGYRLPASACTWLHAQSAMCRLQASNLATFALNGEGIDPECFSFSGSRSDKFHPSISASLNIVF